MQRLLLGATALAISMTSIPAWAQQSSVKSSGYWTAARVDVDDGQLENYMDYLTRVWIPNQEYAKSQGWISDYHVLANVNSRDGEPDIVLITRFKEYPSVEEQDRRNAIINQRNKWDDHSADAASGQRTKMRKLMGSILYQEQVKR
jgi:hypothetical protein